MTETFAIGRASATSPFRDEILTESQDFAPPVEPEFSPPSESEDLALLPDSHREPTEESFLGGQTAGQVVQAVKAALTVQGQSPIAVQATKQWDAKDRPSQWIGNVYGLVVHTTGGGLPRQAQAQGRYHTVHAVDFYTRPKEHGCHYVNGWRGDAGGDLLQIANERERANGVSVAAQRRSIDQGRFEKDLPAVVVERWRARWPGVEHPLRLLPGKTTSANECYIHVECVPCVFAESKDTATPMRPGLRFTKEQHETVARLACDIARRNGWPLRDAWWRSPRLLGHEDLSPLTRLGKGGAYDPGTLREKPYFDWDFVYSMIERECGPRTPAPAVTRPTWWPFSEGEFEEEQEEEQDQEEDQEEEQDQEQDEAQEESEQESEQESESDDESERDESGDMEEVDGLSTPEADPTLEQLDPDDEFMEEFTPSSTMLEGETLMIGGLLRDVATRIAVTTALSRGERRENALTDAGFNVRHPQRPVGPIRRADPRFVELRDDWLDVRNRIVRPALAERATQDKLDRLVPRGRPSGRPCCLVWLDVLEPGSLGSQGAPSETLGEVFTEKLGFVDLGHARETADVTLWALNQIQAGGGKAALTIDLFHGKARLQSDVGIDRRLALAQQLTYVDSVAHELETLGVPGPGMDNSSFSPEDLPSNLFGTVVAASAFAADGGSNAAITTEFKRMLTSAGAQSAAVARQAQAVAKQRGWWVTSGPQVLFPLGKRNLAADPWLIDVRAGSARIQASRTLVAPSLVGPDFAYESTADKIKNADFQTRIDALRASLPPSALTP